MPFTQKPCITVNEIHVPTFPRGEGGMSGCYNCISLKTMNKNLLKE